MYFNIQNVPELTPDEQTLLSALVQVWSNKLTRNSLRTKYYRMKNRLKDLGIAIPPPLQNVETVIGWPAKAVDALAARSRFDGFVSDGEEVSELAAVLRANDFANLYGQAVSSELIHSCSFLTVSKGAAGEPSVLVNAYSAVNAAAIWDRRKKRVKCGLTVVDADDNGFPTWVNLYTDDAVIAIRKAGDVWTAERYPHLQGRPLIEPLVYRPELDRPLGKSRISRAVMSITDSAVRCALRSEVSAEFFTTPQKYLLGADNDLFGEQTPDEDTDEPVDGATSTSARLAWMDNGARWRAYLGNILAISRDENGELPTFGQLPQMTMQPHIDYMRSLAAQFSGETGIPVSSLGIIHDNPASAEAIHAAREDLIIEAEALNATNGNALRNIGLMTLAIMRDKSLLELTDTELTLMPRFKAVNRPSVVSQSDAIVKQVSALPWIADTRVALEELGYTDEQIERMLSDKRRVSALETVRQMSQPGAVTPSQAVPNTTDGTGE